MQNDTLDRQYYLIHSEIMEIGEIQQSDTIGKLKYDKVYILDSMGDNFQDKLLT